jgi:hypothetical protein
MSGYPAAISGNDLCKWIASPGYRVAHPGYLIDVADAENDDAACIASVAIAVRIETG